ncbi:2-oxoglutarate-Fe(II) type oxidoreductase ppzD-like isoform X2 [Branchiostoma floridae]|uniref:2-oxoglutarate-Fe(II) type oxidoreductase ppzD-like isoform X2 n=1 Tax=Branchiostoma floridae TaxID=7739 RepID=A0A9J7HMG2_BRAFL|nr:2-oxoglutarate-Fe(II) type oxidoreductase ppzD-like isoform X2 [Branchiostoma floridae]
MMDQGTHEHGPIHWEAAPGTDGHIPILDFSSYSLLKGAVDEDELQPLATQLIQAFSTVGFVYLRNHGIPSALISRTFETADKFFSLPKEVKTKYSRPVDKGHGWVCLERERLNLERPGDLKEAFNVRPPHATDKLWPSQEMPEFQQVTLQMFDKSRQLSLRIIELMGRGLNIQDMPSLLSMHSMMGTGPNGSVMRTLRYPPVSAHVKAGQIRCGEHTDYGSITLVFQDNVSGLEVCRIVKEIVPASPIPNTVVVNIGDLMQRWTGDKLKSTSHRVVIPETEEGRKTSRRSLAFFAHPDDDAVITCLDGSNKYPPITAGEYLKQKLTATYDVN